MGSKHLRRPALVVAFFSLVLLAGLVTACGGGTSPSSSTGSCTNGCARIGGSCGTFWNCSIFGCSDGGCCYPPNVPHCSSGACGCY